MKPYKVKKRSSLKFRDDLFLIMEAARVVTHAYVGHAFSINAWYSFICSATHWLSVMS